ncbi:MAG: type IV secretory system conjugative DNA transfer family protein [Actinomycetota bacterium]
MSKEEIVWHWLQFSTGFREDEVLHWARTLASRPRRGLLGRADPVIFEAHGIKRRIEWYLGLSQRDAASIVANIRAQLPGLRIVTLKSGPNLQLTRGVELRLNTMRRGLRTDIMEPASSALLTSMRGLASDEEIVLQWLVGPWLPRPVVKRTGQTKQGLSIEQLVLDLPMDSEDAAAYRKKLGEPLLGVVGRIGVRAQSPARQRQLIQRVLGSLQLVRQPGVGLITRLFTGPSVARRMQRLQRPIIAWPCALNAAELTTLLGWPIGNPNLPGVEYGGRQLPPSHHVLTQKDDPRRFRIVARSVFPGREGFLHLAPRSALQHLHVIGPTGSGKSTLLAQLILSDIAAGRGCVVIDPKGDLVADISDRMPDHRIADCVLIDAHDAARPVGINPLKAEATQTERVVDQLVHVFKEIYRDSWGNRTQDIMHAGFLTLAKAGDQTICELPVLLTNQAYRRRILERVKDPLALQPFWNYFEGLSEREQSEVIGPVLNKLRAFTYRSVVRNMVGQAAPLFDMREVFTKRKVVLVNLGKGFVGPEAAKLLGSLIVSTLWQTALSRIAIPSEKRHPVFCYLDEFQDVLHLSASMDEALAQARGLGLGLILAHQHLGQLNPLMRSAVLANVRSRVVFRTTSDASALSESMGNDLEPSDIMHLGSHEIYASLVHDSVPTSTCSGETIALGSSLNTSRHVRSLSSQRYGRDQNEITQEILARREVKDPEGENQSGLGGRRRRVR